MLRSSRFLFLISTLLVTTVASTAQVCASDEGPSAGLALFQSPALKAGSAHRMQPDSAILAEASHEDNTPPPMASAWNQELKRAFNQTANARSWGSQETLSGPGSEVAATAPVRECLGQWFQKYNISVLVDCPCGDANWQGLIPGIERIQYHGYDIADRPLEQARATHAHIPNMTFELLDLTSNVPVRGDLILVRDVIQHLPLERGIMMLQNAKASGARYLAVTSFTDGVNTGTSPAGFYKNDVHAHPFDMPQPLERCQNQAQSDVAAKYWPTDFLELIDLAAWPR